MRVRYLVTNLINILLFVVEAFLLLRFVLRLFGADGNNGFVNWVYENSAVLLDPFRGIFPTRVYENTYVVEFSTLFAVLMYAVAALILVAVIEFVSRPTAGAPVSLKDRTSIKKK